MQVVRRIGALVGLLIVAAVLGLVVWAQSGPAPESVVNGFLQDSAAVLVDEDPWLAFRPAEPRSVGLILYPGGRVEPESYAPLANRMARRGFTVVVPDMPLKLAIFGSGRATAIIDAFPEVDRWVLGGHSLGGAMAVSYIDNHPGAIDGLLLWAAYPADSADISDEDLFATAISGTADGLVSFEEVSDARDRLPATYEIVPIQGGNHAGFGAYGPQDGDGEATVDRDDQWDLIVEASVRLLERVEVAP
ncbi:MAG: alpha/beta hydrolase [Acidimicrobiia bacterium]|nr:MAG: alpha/beta hydrolase [Acidimicrobiia bacterium]